MNKLIHFFAKTAERLLGMDISKWNEAWDVNQTINKDMDIVIIRSSYGRMLDKLFWDFVAKLHLAPQFIRGLYHYFSSAVPWEEQVELFLRLAREAGEKYDPEQSKEDPYWFFDFFVLDLEKLFNECGKNFAQTGIRFIREVQKVTGKTVFVYANSYFYRDNLRKYSAEYDDLYFWLAQYPANEWTAWLNDILTNLTKKPWNIPPSRKSLISINPWDLWQFIANSGKGPEYGIKSKYLDMVVTYETGLDFILKIIGIPTRWFRSGYTLTDAGLMENEAEQPDDVPTDADLKEAYEQGKEEGYKTGYREAIEKMNEFIKDQRALV